MYPSCDGQVLRQNGPDNWPEVVGGYRWLTRGGDMRDIQTDHTSAADDEWHATHVRDLLPACGDAVAPL